MAKFAIVCAAGVVSGKEIMALELGQGLREIGHEVAFVTSRWGSGEFARRSEAAGFPTIRLWLGFISISLRLINVWMTLDQFAHWLPLLKGFRDFLRQFQPEKIVHTNWHHVLLLWPLLNPSRDIFWVHEVSPNEAQYRTVFSLFARRIGKFVAVSQAVRGSLLGLGVNESQVEVVHNGLADPAVFRSDVGLHSNAIGIVGQVAASKGHEDLLAAFRTVVQAFPDAELHIFGKGTAEYEQTLRQMIQVLSLGQNVRWHGFVADRSAIYSNLAIMTVPSRCEDALPTTAIEAAFFGLPVVASRRGGLSEIVEDGETGLLFDMGDVAQHAAAMVRLLEDPPLRRHMGQAARERALNLFSRARFVRMFEKLLIAKR